MSEILTPDQIKIYEHQGFVVCRGMFSPTELDRLTDGLMRTVRRNSALAGEIPYPTPSTTYSVGTSDVEDPDLAFIAMHPRIVDVVETLLGAPVVLSAFIAYLKTPGAKGTRVDYKGLHPTAHQDYKTYHQAGSSLNWCFAIVPIGNLDEQTGPFYAAPGSHRTSRVLDPDPTIGGVRRVHRGDGTNIAPLVDLELRRGDLALMHMFTWHEGGPNRSDHNRLGIYNKYRALNAPPARCLWRSLTTPPRSPASATTTGIGASNRGWTCR